MPPLQGVAKAAITFPYTSSINAGYPLSVDSLLGDIAFPYTVSMKMATQFWRCRAAHGTDIDGVIHALSAGG